MNDYRGNSPYSRFKEHKVKYGRGYRGEEQRNVGERNERRSHETRQTVVQNKRTVVHGNSPSRPEQPNREGKQSNDNGNNNKKSGHEDGNRR
jgi:hypothetical protein